MNYRREIDGLRAVAVLPVILFHGGIAGFGGGFVGVDIFFVLSGYLITSLLIEDLRLGRFSIVRFYERRARRILPALFLIMAVSGLFAWAWMLPTDLRSFSQSLVATVLFASNIYFYLKTGYFDAETDPRPLLHTWSLAVEEQFYLFFPLLLFALWKLGRPAAFGVIAALLSVSLALADWGSRYAPDAAFYLLPSRTWELLAGSVCAFLLSGRPLRPNDILAGAGLCLILASVFAFDKATPFPGVYALVPVAGTVLIILFAGQGNRVAQFLSARPLVGIGLISYSAYLWHQPLFEYVRLRSITPPSQATMTVLLVPCLALAYCSWRFVEQPFRRGPNIWLAGRRSLFGAAGGASALFAMVGLGGHYLQMGSDALRENTQGECNVDQGNCYHREPARFRVALWGDSYADAFAESLGKAVNEAGGSLDLYILHSCPSLLGVLRNEDDRLGDGQKWECQAHNQAAIRNIRLRGYDAVVLTSGYATYAKGKNERGEPVIVPEIGGHGSAITTTASGLLATITVAASAAAQVILVTPHPWVDDFATARKRVFFGDDRQIYANPAGAATLRAALVAPLDAAALPYTEVSGLTWFCSGGRCPIIRDDGAYLLYDGSHISTALSPMVAQQVLSQIRAAGQPTR